MPQSYHETEHQELFVLDADLTAPIHLHVPSALGPLSYLLCLRLPAAHADTLGDTTARLTVGGLRPDDVECRCGQNVPSPAQYPSAAAGEVWMLFSEARVSRGDATLTFANLPSGLTRAHVLLCTWPRFIASGQADSWIACQADPAWAPGGVPLGGIGTGKVEVSRDGRFRNFSGNNNQDMPLEEPDGLDGAGLLIGCGDQTVALATRPCGAVAPCPSLTAALRFPQVTLTAAAALPELDAQVRLAGPTVPHNLELASLPGFILRWRLDNHADEAREIDCTLAWPNVVGAGGGIDKTESQTGYADGYYRYFEAPEAPAAETVTGDGFTALAYTNSPNPISPSADGKHLVAVRTDAARVTCNPDSRRGSITATVSVAPGASATVDMAVCWAMPHWIDTLGEDRGAYWQNHCTDGQAILKRLFTDFQTILDEGAALAELLAETDLPDWLRDRLSNCCYPLVTNSVFYRDGRFSINEGPTEMAGCYGTIDQRLGAHPATQILFPALNQQELDEFAAYQAENGGINHDLGGGHLEAGPQDRGWPDLHCSFILQHARHAWSTGDSAFAAGAWPKCVAALERHAGWAEAGGGVAQVGDGLGTSYDGYHYHGTTPYMATLWIAALQVMQRWAVARGDAAVQARAEALLAGAHERLEADLWNGRYYRAYGSQSGPQNDNCHAGMLAGEVFARLLAGTDVLPHDRLTSCCAALLDLNGSDAFRIPPDEVSPEGTCMVEYGWLPYVESFGLTALAINKQTGFLAPWERVLKAMDGGGAHPCDTRLMYQPLNGLPSWGAYYMTAPASWLVYDAALDFWCEPGNGTLRLAPLWEGRFAVVHPRFWALGEHQTTAGSETVSLTCRQVFGEAPVIKALEVPAGPQAITVDGEARTREAWTPCYDRVAIAPMTLTVGTRLSWTVG